MKIALVRVKYNSHIITPPLGIGYISSCLKQHGHETLIIDALRDKLQDDEIIEILDRNEINVVGLTCLTAFYKEVVQLSKKLKARGKRVIIGGAHPTFLPKETLEDSDADFVIIGDGELALTELADKNLDNSEIQGVYSKNDLPQNPKRAKIVENLDELPFPDWEQINPQKYPIAPFGAVTKNYPIGVLLSSRGCPCACTFCANPNISGRKVRMRSPENIVSEIEYLVKNFNVKEISFIDDNLLLDKNHAKKLFNLIIQKGLNKLSFCSPNGIRADSVTKDLMDLMKKAGWYYVAFGIESANPQILLNIKKNESVDIIKNAVKTAKDAKLEVQGFFIFGLPGETKETIKETTNFAVNSGLTRAQFLILDVLPGCELWDKLQGKFKPDFAKDSYRYPEYIPDGLTKEDLILAQKNAFRKFYFRPKIIISLLKYIHLKQIQNFLKRLTDYGIFKKN